MSTPSFPKRDPADPAFWDLRYEAGFAPWDAGRVPARLRDFAAANPPPRRVLVPGCGSAWDVRFLAEAGFDVLGVDFSAEAVAAARRVVGAHADRIAQADFFAALPGEPFDWIYERAFLCALPRRRWRDWAERVAALLPADGLLLGYFFFGDGERGPPFPLHSREELEALLSPRFACIEDAAVEDSIDVFEGKERWQAWRKRAADP